jgi:uncharacterized protein (TIRG00374 family)
MKKLNGFLLALGLVFLVVLICRIGVGELWRELSQLGWGLVPLILGEGLAEMFHAISWRYCLVGPYRSVPIPRLFRINITGYAINYLTPTATLGGDVTKTALLAINHRVPEAVAGILVSKLSFALAHLLFVTLGTLLVQPVLELPHALWVLLLTGGGVILIGIITFLFVQKHGKLGVVIRWLAKRNIGGKMLRRLAGNIGHVDESLKIYYRDQPWGLPLSIFWHFLGYSVGIFQTWFFLHLLTDDTSIKRAAGAWFLAMWFDLLAFAVPLNLGVMEGGRIVAFAAVGYNSVLGITYGVAFRLAQLFWAGFGLVNYALLIPKKSRFADDPISNQRETETAAPEPGIPDLPAEANCKPPDQTIQENSLQPAPPAGRTSMSRNGRTFRMMNRDPRDKTTGDSR